MQAITDITGSDNMVNIKRHNSNKNLAMAQGDMPLGKLNFPTPKVKTDRSSHLWTSKSHF